MKILQAMAGAPVGGAEAFFMRLVPALSEAGIEQHVVLRKHPERAEIFHKHEIPLTQVAFGGPLDIGSKFKFARAIKKFQPDIVMSWMNRATAMCPKGEFTHVARLGGYYNLKYYRNCDHLIGNTKDIVSYLTEEGWPEEKAHYVPNFVAEGKATDAQRKHYSIPESAPVLLALGRMHDNKAFDVLIESLAKVPGLYCILAGEGPKRKELEDLARKRGVRPRMRFVGWVDDIESLFAVSDLFVCPSRHEPLGNVVIEGWAHQKPVIAAASQGPTQLINHNKNGLLFDVDDHDTLANHIKSVLNNNVQAHNLALAGYESFKKDFTKDVVIQKYIEFFESILKKQDS